MPASTEQLQHEATVGLALWRLGDKSLIALWLSIAVPILGVAAVPFARRRPGLLSGIDGFVMVAIGGVVLLHLLPFAIRHLGFWAFVLLVFGAFVPWLLERRTHTRGADRAFALMAVVGVAIHTFFDGAALVAASLGPDQAPLGVAVVLHRLPVGLMIGLLLGGPKSWRAWLGVALVVGGTFAGYFTGEASLPSLGLNAIAAYQAFIGGMLAHVIYAHAPHAHAGAAAGEDDHDHHHDRGVAAAGWTGGVGALLGVVVLLLLEVYPSAGHAHAHVLAHTHDAGLAHAGGPEGPGEIFLYLALESAPALLLAFAGGGLIVAFLRSSHMDRLSRGSRSAQALRGMAIGLPLPICSCGVLPVYDGLVRRGVPPAAGLAFLVATPELGLDAILISWPLLGPVMTIARLAAAALVAWGVAVLVSRSMPSREVGSVAADVAARHEDEEADEDHASVGEKLRRAARYGFVDQSDQLLPWILVGLGVAAWAQPLLANAGLASVSWWAQVPLGALIGLPIYVCASGSTPLAAVLMASGLSPGAALAFLLTGPASNITTFGALTKWHGRGIAVRFAIGIVLGAMVAGWLVDGFLGSYIAVPTLGGHEHEDSRVIQWICLGLLSIAAVASLLRVGPRGWMHELGVTGGHHHDDDDHHDHDAPACGDGCADGCS